MSGDGRIVALSGPRDLTALKAALHESWAAGFATPWLRPLSLKGMTALEMSLQGTAFPRLEKRLAPLRQEGLDLSLQPGRLGPQPPGLLVMDMDSTLVEQEGIDELARQVGVYEKVAAVTERAMRGEMDFDESLRQRVDCLRGASEQILGRVRSRIRLTPGARRLVQEMRRRGTRLGLLSGGFRQLGSGLAAELGFDHFHANVLEVEGGRLTGRVQGPIVNARRKAQLLQELSALHGLAPSQTAAVGDGANDLPMLLDSGLGIAFCAKPEVRRQALHSIDQRRLDAALYLMGLSDDEISMNPD